MPTYVHGYEARESERLEVIGHRNFGHASHGQLRGLTTWRLKVQARGAKWTLRASQI